MPGPAVSRPMTFTGCWTCKERKVRCDERPAACKNCEKRGVACGGYDIRLQWVSDPFVNVAPSNGKGRRSIKLDRQSGNRYRMKEIDDFLATIDDDAGVGLSPMKGPFSAFPVNARRPQGAKTQPTPKKSIAAFDILDENQENNHNDQDTLVIDSNTSDVTYTTELPETAMPSSFLSIPRPEYSPITEDTRSSHSPQPLGTEEGIELCWGQTDPCLLSVVDDITERDMALIPLDGPLNSRTAFEVAYPARSRLINPLLHHINYNLFGDADVDVLLNHYRVYVSDLLQPVLHAQNVYRQVYLPTALEGTSLSLSDPKTSKALAHSAIYHSLLASSAFHLWSCDKTQARYRSIGAKHRYQALHCLQAAVNSAAPGSDYKVFMVAILSLVTIGVMSGEGEDFLVHINGASQLRNSRNRWRIISRPTQLLNGISVFLALLARTTSFRATPSPWREISEPDSFSDDGVIQSSNCYEYMYGITPTIASAIRETCRLAEFLTWFGDSPETSIPDEILEACEALGDKLLSWKLSDERIAFIPPDDDLNFTVFCHHANAWHLAALIYYYRRIQHSDAADLGEEIERVARHMTLAEDTKARLKCHTQRTTAPITWPSFIASCDAVGTCRELWREWWERVDDYRIANIRTQWETVQQIWEKVDHDRQLGLKTDWIDAFSSLGCHILAV